jgi:hypothetical protein
MNTFIKFASVGVVAMVTSFGTVHVESASLASASLGDVSLGMVEPARADAAGWGYEILKCFHPTADFVRVSSGDLYTDANGRRAADGRIDFRGGYSGNSYFMTFVVHVKTEDKDTMIRVTPISDNAPFAPNPSCMYREWQRVD